MLRTCSSSSSPRSSSGSLVRPKVVRSVHYCPATKKTMERKYTDMTSLDAFPSSAIYPTKVPAAARMFVFMFQIVEGILLQMNSDDPNFSSSSSLDRTRRTTLWRRSLGCPSTRTTRPLRCRRCQRKPPLDSCLALWTSSWTTTWWTWSNPETESRSSERTAAFQERREGSPPARSGELEYNVSWSC